MTNGFVLRAKFMLDTEWASAMAMMASVSLSEAKICCPPADMAWASPSVLVQTVPFSFRASSPHRICHMYVMASSEKDIRSQTYMRDKMGAKHPADMMPQN